MLWNLIKNVKISILRSHSCHVKNNLHRSFVCSNDIVNWHKHTHQLPRSSVMHNELGRTWFMTLWINLRQLGFTRHFVDWCVNVIKGTHTLVGFDCYWKCNWQVWTWGSQQWLTLVAEWHAQACTNLNDFEENYLKTLELNFNRNETLCFVYVSEQNWPFKKLPSSEADCQLCLSGEWFVEQKASVKQKKKGSNAPTKNKLIRGIPITTVIRMSRKKLVA